jgi:hypothetical protein
MTQSYLNIIQTNEILIMFHCMVVAGNQDAPGMTPGGCAPGMTPGG